MTKEIAVDGASLEFMVGSGTITISPGQTTNKVKFDGKPAYTSLNFTISGYTGGAITNGDGAGSGSINASAQAVKVAGAAAFLKGDTSATITISGTTGPYKTPVTSPDTVRISDAGQTKVKGR